MGLLRLHIFLLNSEAEFEISHVSQLLFFLASTTHSQQVRNTVTCTVTNLPWLRGLGN